MPVSTASRSRGISTVMFLRLCSRAPRTMIRSSGMTAPDGNGLALAGHSRPAGALHRGRRTAPAWTAGAPPAPAAREEWLPQSLAQLPDLIPEDRGLLKLQLARGLAHLALERFDRLLELARAEHEQACD